MKILIFMSDNRKLTGDIDVASYESLTAAINFAYATRHGYDFIYYNPYLNGTGNPLYNCVDRNNGKIRHASWSKLLSTKKALELDYDYVVYIDSDCIFKDHDFCLESIINSNPTKLCIFWNNYPWSSTEPCAGFYIAKVTPETKTIFDFWYNCNYPHFNKTHPWEQHALHNFYNTINIAILDNVMFEERPLQILRHIGSDEDKKYNSRIPYFKQYIRRNRIPFKTDMIKTISYSTSDIVKVKMTPNPTFNVLIATLGRPTLQNMLNSLAPQLNTNDCLTIVYDGQSEVPTFNLSELKCTIKQYCEPVALGFWGHGIRNKYAKLLNGRTFVLHADDDNIYKPNVFEFLRNECVDPQCLYITNLDWNMPNTVFKTKKVIEGNIDTACGIIPYKLNTLGTWLPRFGGDGAFYETISQKSTTIKFVDKVIYTMRPHIVNSQSSTDSNQPNTGLKLSFLRKTL
jgi:hypothetical protein